MFDIIIRNGHIVNGTGNTWYKADIGIRKDSIEKIGRLEKEQATRIIDAKGLVVCPGFIDMHSHSDFALLINPKADSKIHQGITTEVIGNCGGSAAPLNDPLKDEIRKTTPLFEEAKLELNWQTMREYLERLKRQGIALNVAPLVGHENIRVLAIGFDDRAPTDAELRKMKKTLRQAMEDGAFGMSTGLIYPPGCYAKTDELIELSKAVAKHGGIYTSHIRGEGNELLSSVKEAIKIGERARLPVEISHHKAGGKDNWGKVKRTLKMMEEARARGIDVTCDVYPYTAGSFGLSAMVTPWAHEGGSPKLIERLKTPEIRKRLKKEMQKGTPTWSSPVKAAGWDDTLIARSTRHKEYEGKTVAEIADAKKVDPYEFTFDLLIEENASVSVVRFAMCEEDVRTVVMHPATMIGTDASAIAPHGVLGKGKPHPRAYGTFPRVLGKYVREEKVLRMEDAVRKMTSLPAQKLGLRDRGLIAEGMKADITIFSPAEVADKATYTVPHQYPQGVEYVLVNGKVVINKGRHTGTLGGKALRKP